MKNVLFIFLTLLLLSCSNDSTYNQKKALTFGYDLADFTKGESERYANGECWGTLQEYFKDDIKIVMDNKQCSDYKFSKFFLLFENNKINTAQSITFETMMEKENKKFSTTESIYNFSADSPTIYKRTEILKEQNPLLLTTNFDTLQMDSVNIQALEFINRLAMAKSQILKDGEILIALTHGEVKVDEQALSPQIDIYMTSSIFGKSVLLVNDFNINQIEGQKSRKDFAVPDEAILAFYSWFAGEGSCYYGVLEKEQFVVFRKFLKEQKTEELPFKVFKNFSIIASPNTQLHD